MILFPGHRASLHSVLSAQWLCLAVQEAEQHRRGLRSQHRLCHGTVAMVAPRLRPETFSMLLRLHPSRGHWAISPDRGACKEFQGLSGMYHQGPTEIQRTPHLQIAFSNGQCGWRASLALTTE